MSDQQQPQPTSGPTSPTTAQPGSPPATQAGTQIQASVVGTLEADDQGQGAQDAPADNDNDGSSISGHSTDESHASLRSSILDYRRENGRTYHRLSDGKYLVPNDALEQERLDLINHMWTIIWDGRFCLCPKDDGARRVLDIGTGTGVWAMDYADTHPEAQVIGADLSPIQPTYVPPNCIFEVDDLEKEWTWSEPFDFIFARNMMGSFSDWPGVIEQAYNNLEPGGYFEIHDTIYPILCDDGSVPEDSAISKWSRLMMESFEKLGRSVTIARQFPQFLEEAGFEHVTLTKCKHPLNDWPKDPKWKEVGSWVQESLFPGLEGLSLGLFTRVLDWTRDETLVFCAQVRNDVKNKNLHGYYDGVSVYGRKPFPKKDQQ